MHMVNLGSPFLEAVAEGTMKCTIDEIIQSAVRAYAAQNQQVRAPSINELAALIQVFKDNGENTSAWFKRVDAVCRLPSDTGTHLQLMTLTVI